MATPPLSMASMPPCSTLVSPKTTQISAVLAYAPPAQSSRFRTLAAGATSRRLSDSAMEALLLRPP